MDITNLPIRKLNTLFNKKDLKPSELYSKIFDNAVGSEASLHAH